MAQDRSAQVQPNFLQVSPVVAAEKLWMAQHALALLLASQRAWAASEVQAIDGLACSPGWISDRRHSTGVLGQGQCNMSGPGLHRLLLQPPERSMPGDYEHRCDWLARHFHRRHGQLPIVHR